MVVYMILNDIITLMYGVIIIDHKFVIKQTINKRKTLIIIINKWDNIQNSEKKLLLKKYTNNIKQQFPQLTNIITIPLSAKIKLGIYILINQIIHTYNLCKQYIPTSTLNK